MSQDRFPLKVTAELSEPQRVAYNMLTDATAKYFGDEFIYKSQSGSFLGPFNPLLDTPGICKPFVDMVLAIASIPGFSITARETVILVVGAHYKTPYEIYAHERLALRNTDLSLEQIMALKAGEKPDGLDAAASVSFDTTLALLTEPGPLCKETWSKLVEVLGKQGALAVVQYVAWYAYNSMLMNACDVQLPEGEKNW